MEENETKKTKKEVVKAQKVKQNSSKGNTILASIFALFLGAACMYLLIYYVIPIDNSNTIINKSEKEVTVTDKGIADAVEKLYDAVVVIEVFSNNRVVATGTGFVYKTDGKKSYILTNAHVINAVDKGSVKVIFTDGDEVDVKVEGSDEYSDLAVLSVDSKEVVTVAEIGNTEDLRLGDTVFTVGAPLDTEYYWTVTRGILSGKDRMVEVSLDDSYTSTSGDYIMRVLQTDASINSGNSGGPLANSNGEVIGITNMKLVSSGVEGIGFAIPIEDAVDFAETIIKGESIKRPVLGLSMLDLTNTLELYRQHVYINTELEQGVVVIQVQANSPAEKAKLKKGDIIIGIDDNEIKNVAALRYNLYQHKVGDTIKITFERDGKIETTEVKLTVASE